jgi:soluble lytic murein transglycosylase
VRRRRRRRRRAVLLLGFTVLAALLAAFVIPRLPDAVRELALPLRHEDIIRQQAAAKGLDPSLVAAVIYTESKFRDQTSHAGARGLMQITPATARYIAHLSGGTAFEQGDLATPQINISYGVYYLRYLLRRYDGNKVLALAAYNGGEGNVDHWIAASGAPARDFQVSAIPFTETRDYVGRVLDAQRQYRDKYPRELGLAAPAS